MTLRRKEPRETLLPPIGGPEFVSFAENAKSLGILIRPTHTEQIITYIAELLRWNQRISLTATKDVQGILNEHVLDSLVPVKFMEGVKTLVDVGAGAGFPGIPIKILRPEIGVVFIESRRKRTSFLQRVIGLLDLSGCEAIWARAEDEEVRARFMESPADAIITRAAVREDSALDFGATFTQGKGRIFLMKGDLPDQERRALEMRLEERGTRINRVVSYRLPGMSKRRNLVIIG